MDTLEWDAKLRFALNAALHDAAVVAWDLKADVDYVRPISMIRYMAALGQSSEPGAADYHADGLPLEDGLVERVTAATAAAGGGGKSGHAVDPESIPWSASPTSVIRCIKRRCPG